MKFKNFLIALGLAVFSIAVTQKSVAQQTTNINMTIDSSGKSTQTVITTSETPKANGQPQTVKARPVPPNPNALRAQAEKDQAAKAAAAREAAKPKVEIIKVANKKDLEAKNAKPAKSAGAKNLNKSNSKQPKQKSITQKKRKKMSEREQMERDMRAFEMASYPTRSEQNQATSLNSSTSTRVDKVKPEGSSKFNGSFTFGVGTDNNIDPDKKGITDTFYEVKPKLGFESSGFTGSFGASIRDYQNPDNSEMFRTNEANVSLGYKVKISDITTSTTTFSTLYHDERWPDYLNNGDKFNGRDEFGNADSMPIRYSDFKLEQTLGFKVGALGADIGGHILRRDSYSLFTDWASDVLGENLFERDYMEYRAFGKLSVEAAKFLELTATPSVSQLIYDEGTREALQPNGSPGGQIGDAPRYQKTTSQLEGEIAFKFLGSHITPVGVIGQSSDEGLGAEDSEFVGVGLKSDLVLHEKSKFKISPNVMYKRETFDNWTNRVADGKTRVDQETTAGIEAGVNLNKNFNIALAYNVIRARTSFDIGSASNFEQNVFMSSMTFSF